MAGGVTFPLLKQGMWRDCGTKLWLMRPVEAHTRSNVAESAPTRPTSWSAVTDQSDPDASALNVSGLNLAAYARAMSCLLAACANMGQGQVTT